MNTTKKHNIIFVIFFLSAVLFVVYSFNTNDSSATDKKVVDNLFWQSPTAPKNELDQPKSVTTNADKIAEIKAANPEISRIKNSVDWDDYREEVFDFINKNFGTYDTESYDGYDVATLKLWPDNLTC